MPEEFKTALLTRGQKIRTLVMTAGILLLVILISISSTTGQLNTRTEDLDNEFAFGKTGVTVEENFDGWDVKEVSLTAEAGADCVPGVARARLMPYVLTESGGYTPSYLGELPAAITGNDLVMGDITLNLASDWSDNWFYKDGCFYYKKVLAPGETTALLLQKVSLTEDTPAMREKYGDAEIKVEVIAEILQAEGGAPASKWGVTVTGNTVSP